MKLKVGDKVRIVNYGHLIWSNEDGEGKAIDIRPELVGRKATIIGVSINMNPPLYKVQTKDGNRIAWFSKNQLKKRI